jgi:hypothetical protein
MSETGPAICGKRGDQTDRRITIVPGTLRDIAFVTANLRPQDRREISASADLASTVEAAVIAYETSQDWCWTAQIAGQPVAAFGIATTSPLTPHIRAAWAFGTKRFRRAVPAISRFAGTRWPDLLAGNNVRRLEVRSLASHDIAHRWLTNLGARLEGDLSGYGTGGETFQLWAWTSAPPQTPNTSQTNS